MENKNGSIWIRKNINKTAIYRVRYKEKKVRLFSCRHEDILKNEKEILALAINENELKTISKYITELKLTSGYYAASNSNDDENRRIPHEVIDIYEFAERAEPMSKAKAVVTTSGHLVVNPNKVVEFSISLTAEKMLALSRDEFEKAASETVFGNDMFTYESVEAINVNESGVVTLNVKGNIQAMVSAGKIQIIDQPKLKL
ncbi:MAG: hypothetical protein RSD49_06465 [Hafnia sp.]